MFTRGQPTLDVNGFGGSPEGHSHAGVTIQFDTELSLWCPLCEMLWLMEACINLPHARGWSSMLTTPVDAVFLPSTATVRLHIKT